MGEHDRQQHFCVDVIATVCTDPAGLRRWVAGSASRRCAGASTAALTVRDRLRIAAPDAAHAARVARRALLESALGAGMAIGAVHAEVRGGRRAEAAGPGAGRAAQRSPSRQASSSRSRPRS